MSTYQKLFDKAAAGIIAQGCQSMATDFETNGDEEICAYRGVHNCKCAIGHNLTDEQISAYNVKEGYGPASFSEKLVKEMLSDEDLSDLHYDICDTLCGKAVDFLVELQSVHDFKTIYSDKFVYSFRIRMNEFAVKWNLKGIGQ